MCNNAITKDPIKPQMCRYTIHLQYCVNVVPSRSPFFKLKRTVRISTLGDALQHRREDVWLMIVTGVETRMTSAHITANEQLHIARTFFAKKFHHHELYFLRCRFRHFYGVLNRRRKTDTKRTWYRLRTKIITFFATTLTKWRCRRKCRKTVYMCLQHRRRLGVLNCYYCKKQTVA